MISYLCLSTVGERAICIQSLDNLDTYSEEYIFIRKIHIIGMYVIFNI